MVTCSQVSQPPVQIIDWLLEKEGVSHTLSTYTFIALILSKSSGKNGSVENCVMSHA